MSRNLDFYILTGVFFLPMDQQHDRPTKVTNYSGLCYLGGYAHAWAACLSNEGIYNLLLEKVSFHLMQMPLRP